MRDDWNRQRILEAINAEGVPCFVGSCSEIYLEKAFLEPMRPAHRLTVAKDLGETSLMFLVHPTLTEADMRDTADAVEKVMTVATHRDGWVIRKLRTSDFRRLDEINVSGPIK